MYSSLILAYLVHLFFYTFSLFYSLAILHLTSFVNLYDFYIVPFILIILGEVSIYFQNFCNVARLIDYVMQIYFVIIFIFTLYNHSIFVSIAIFVMYTIFSNSFIAMCLIDDYYKYIS